ncbi:hypothetical protein L6452_33829 [Arctium lappa]|uniref:Uncharacterized protein n=1 Tax=Arctium lappa TaxID=4217 RepID=A0ACB8YGJ2_ARCLA|nr:hypothetical protein L6452_33829 [Arctium lappa]
MSNRNDDEKGLLWKLPALYSDKLGKLGPAFGVGAGCGIGFGVGMIGGAGLGPGIPGLQIGFGFGAGCGVGVGFGYGAGRGIAYDENRQHSNLTRAFRGPATFPIQDEIGGLIDEVVVNTKKLIKATHREVEKWRR